MIYRERIGDAYTSRVCDMTVDEAFKANQELRQKFSDLHVAWWTAGNRDLDTKPRLVSWDSEQHRKGYRALVITDGEKWTFDFEAGGPTDAAARAPSIMRHLKQAGQVQKIEKIDRFTHKQTKKLRAKGSG